MVVLVTDSSGEQPMALLAPVNMVLVYDGMEYRIDAGDPVPSDLLARTWVIEGEEEPPLIDMTSRVPMPKRMDSAPMSLADAMVTGMLAETVDKDRQTPGGKAYRLLHCELPKTIELEFTDKRQSLSGILEAWHREARKNVKHPSEDAIPVLVSCRDSDGRALPMHGMVMHIEPDSPVYPYLEMLDFLDGDEAEAMVRKMQQEVDRTLAKGDEIVMTYDHFDISISRPETTPAS